MHLNAYQAVAAAGLAASALCVEGETALLIAAHPGVLGRGKQAADIVENAGIGRRIRARRTADGALVKRDHLIHVFKTLDPVVFSGSDLGPVLLGGQNLVQDLLHQRRFPAARYPGHADQLPQREAHRQVLEIVFARSVDNQFAAVALPARAGDRDALFSAQILSRHGLGAGHDFLRRSGADDPSAVDAGPGADVDDMVCGRHGLFIVFDHDQRVAEVAQAVQRLQQPGIVPLVQADARLVQRPRGSPPNAPGSDSRGPRCSGSPDGCGSP